MPSTNADSANDETLPPSTCTAKELVQGLMHLILQTSNELIAAPSQFSNDEAEVDDHADRIQDLDNKLVSQALEVWLAHDGKIDLRTFFPAETQVNSAKGNPIDQSEPRPQRAEKSPATILGNPSLFPRTNQFIFETTSLDTFYAWLFKTLPRLPAELVFLVAHTSLLSNASSNTPSPSSSVPAIPSLFSYYLPHLYPYPGPCTAHVPNCPRCCTFPNSADDESPRHDLPPAERRPPFRSSTRSSPCITTTTTTTITEPSTGDNTTPNRSPYASLSARLLRATWNYDSSGCRMPCTVRRTGAFRPCAASGGGWMELDPSNAFDDASGTWRCGCMRWRQRARASGGRLLWDAWRRGWGCGEAQPFDGGCCVDDWDEEDVRAWEEADERERDGRGRAGMRWIGVGECGRCGEEEEEEEEEEDLGF